MCHAGSNVLPFAATHAASRFFCHLALDLFPAGDRLGWTFAGPGVGVGALTANRQTPAMADTAVTTEVHEAFDIHRRFAPQITFNGIIGVDDFPDLDDFGVGQFIDPPR